MDTEKIIIIIKKDLRNIFIWKGFITNTRQKFRASKIASILQQEPMKRAGFYSYKIFDIDQGDEPQEFLDAFNW